MGGDRVHSLDRTWHAAVGCRYSSCASKSGCSARFVWNSRALVERLIGDERMIHGVLRLHPSIWVPTKTTCDEIQEGFVLRFQSLSKCLRTRSAPSALATNSDPGLANRIEEKLFSCATIHQVPIRGSKDLHDAGKLFLFVLTWEQRIACPQLSQDTAQRPHIDAEAIAAAEYDFRTSIEARLNVRVHFLFLLAAAAKINHPYIGLARFAEQDIFRFQIAMDDPLVLQKN